MNEKILKEILQELKNIHYHLDRMEVSYMMVNRIEIKEKKKKEIIEDKK